MSYAATLRYLYALQYRGIKVGLRNIRRLTAFAGHPELSFPVFHIAGTNGKGSTSSFLASVLTASGYRTGLYTSPHLVDFVERIRIDGVPMPEAELVEYIRLLRPLIEETGATFFEATTCAAFQYFSDHAVDVAVIETGLGGRLDATNVVMPLVSIITNIGLDHQEILGKTIRKIAVEKAGIIKQGAPVVTATTGEALEVMRAVARSRGTRLFIPAQVVSMLQTGAKAGQAIVDVAVEGGLIRGALLGLGGGHQVTNASLALAALALAGKRGLFPRVTPGTIKRGLAHVRDHAGLRCRLERISPPWGEATVDVAHNPDGVRAATTPFDRDRTPYFDVAVFGAMKDKDYGGMLSILKASARVVVAVRPQSPRAATVRDIVSEGRKRGVAIVAGGTVKAGLALGRRIARKAQGRRKARILVIGSHFVAGEALLALENTS